MNSPKKQPFNLYILIILLFITIVILGCSSDYFDDDPILYLVSGNVVNNNSQLPLDSVKVTAYRDENMSNYGVSDSTGFFGLGAVGYFRDSFDLLLHFEKGGYISKDTSVEITKQGEKIDSLIIYLNRQ